MGWSELLIQYWFNKELREMIGKQILTQIGYLRSQLNFWIFF